jgi:hypothetical protein
MHKSLVQSVGSGAKSPVILSAAKNPRIASLLLPLHLFFAVESPVTPTV